MALRQMALRGTTNASGDATIDAPVAIFGRLYAVEWDQGTLSVGADGVLSVQGSPIGARTLLTLTNPTTGTYYPRDVQHDAAGTALTGTAGGDRTMPVIDGILRLVLAQGGNTQTGGMIVYYLTD
jgi:hypothetical protein